MGIMAYQIARSVIKPPMQIIPAMAAMSMTRKTSKKSIVKKGFRSKIYPHVSIVTQPDKKMINTNTGGVGR